MLRSAALKSMGSRSTRRAALSSSIGALTESSCGALDAVLRGTGGSGGNHNGARSWSALNRGGGGNGSDDASGGTPADGLAPRRGSGGRGLLEEPTGARSIAGAFPAEGAAVAGDAGAAVLGRVPRGGVDDGPGGCALERAVLLFDAALAGAPLCGAAASVEADDATGAAEADASPEDEVVAEVRAAAGVAVGAAAVEAHVAGPAGGATWTRAGA